MTRFGRQPHSGWRNMGSRRGTRLNLEHLEGRRLLSALGFPTIGLPEAPASPPAIVSESRLTHVEHSFDAVLGAPMTNTMPAVTAQDTLVVTSGGTDVRNVAVLATGLADPRTTSPADIAIAAWRDAGHEDAATGGQLGSLPSPDVSLASDPDANATIATANDADGRNDPPVGEVSSLPQSATIARPDAASEVAPSFTIELSLDMLDAATSSGVASDASPDVGAPSGSLQHGAGEEFAAGAPSGLPAGLGHIADYGQFVVMDGIPPDPSAFDQGRSPRPAPDDAEDVSNAPPMPQFSPVLLAPISHSIEVAVPVSVKSEPAPVGDLSSTLAGSNRDVPAWSASVEGEGAAGMESDVTTPPSGGQANLSPSSSQANIPDAALGNAVEGFAATDDTSIAVLQWDANANGLSDAESGDIGSSGLIADIMPGSLNGRGTGSNAASRATGSDRAQSGRNDATYDAVVAVSAQAKTQATLDADAGGTIEFGVGATADCSAGVPPAGRIAGGTPAPQSPGMSDIRPESGAGLYCDIEVAVGGGAPSGSPADGSAALPAPATSRALVAPPTMRTWCPGGIPAKAGTTNEGQGPGHRVDSPRQDSPDSTDRVPLFVGAAIVAISSGLGPTGIRREEPDPLPQRRLHNIVDLRNEPRG